MPRATFRISLGAEKVVLFYKAKKNRILVTADDGRTLSVPWSMFRAHIGSMGIRGSFELVFDDTGKALSLKRLDPPQ